MPAKKTTQANVWQRVEKGLTCWLWTGFVERSGYGRVWWNGKQDLAHRVIYRFVKGEIPDDLVVMHSCDNPTCVNPEHLSLGTHLDNRLDCIQKKRTNLPAGQAHHKSLVSDVGRIFIVGMKQHQERGDGPRLAAAFHVTPSCIRSIQTRAL